MLDPRSAKTRRYLVNHLFSGEIRFYHEFLDLFDAAVRRGSMMPYEAAMITFRDKYRQVGKTWSQHPGHESIEEGGPGSGNFGHAGRPGEVGGSAPEGGKGSEEVLDSIPVLHGTTSSNLDNILKNGLGIKDSAVCVTTNKNTAIEYAQLRAGQYPNKGSVPVVLHVMLPRGTPMNPIDPWSTAFVLMKAGDWEGRIKIVPPEWIKGYTVIGVDGSESYVSLREGVTSTSRVVVVYLPLVLSGRRQKKVLKEGGPGSGNFGHAGRLGHEGGSKKGTGGAGRGRHGPGDTTILTGDFNLEDEAKEYSKIWANWKQENSEKMLFITKDGKMIIVSSGAKGEVGISLKDISKILKDEGTSFSNLKMVVHNHNKGEAPSAGDIKVYRSLMAAGFGGDSKIYTPKTGSIRTVPYSAGESLSLSQKVKRIREALSKGAK